MSVEYDTPPYGYNIFLLDCLRKQCIKQCKYHLLSSLPLCPHWCCLFLSRSARGVGLEFKSNIQQQHWTLMHARSLLLEGGLCPPCLII